MDGSAAQTDPPYARIVAEIRRRIAAGELRPGDRVPSTRRITQEWGVAMATATKVLTALRQEGLVRAVPGVGTVVDAAESRPAPAPTRRRREARDGEPELTRERIVRAAIDVADAEGLSALSMRRVATDLGVGAMSLYRYVPGKDELIVLMTEAVFAEDRLPEPPPPGWRAQLELVARLEWAIYRRHPWVARVVSFSRPVPAPDGMAHTELAMRAAASLGLDPATALLVSMTLAAQVLGIAVSLESELEAQQDTGITGDEWMDAREATWERHMASGRFPMLFSVGEDFDPDLDSIFEIGLTLTLDGLAALAATQR